MRKLKRSLRRTLKSLAILSEVIKSSLKISEKRRKDLRKASKPKESNILRELRILRRI